MASSARIDELKKKFDENPRRYFAPLANEFRKGGDLEQAILICEEFLPHQPGHMSGHIVYGQTLFESARLDDARSVFETALSLDPENLIALRHLGDIAGQQGDTTGARRWYERVLEADPRNDEIQALITGLDGGTTSRSAATPLMPIELEATMPHGVPVVDLHAEVPGYGALELASADIASSESLGLGGIVPMPDTAQLMPDIAEVADGFEATEFMAPETSIAQTAGLQSAFEDETGIFGAAARPVDGLAESHAAMDGPIGFPDLDGDDGLVLPPHGDYLGHAAAAPSYSLESMDSLESMELEGSDTSPVPDAAAAGTALPLELPPEVIAAEAELVESGMSMEQSGSEYSSDGADMMDEGAVGSELTFLDTAEPEGVDAQEAESFAAEPEAIEPDAVEPEAVDTVAAAPIEDADEPEDVPSHRPFVTETMAELYLTQGFHEQALQVYEQLSAASPDDARLADKVASLRSATSASAPASDGLTVREFLSRLAARRPGTASAQAAPPDESDFALHETHTSTPDSDRSEPGAELASNFASVVETPATPSAEPVTPQHAHVEAPGGGTIDALFGHEPTGAIDDSAASALAQAFGAGASAPPITGKPARPATGELSLDSVFRDGPSRAARASQGFSFDQFFSPHPEGESTGGASRPSQELPGNGEPAEKSADDIEQFNSWLQGLKNR
ncbi:MAG: tetratricopeptide repeat protein [bacterium]